jgi:hypothetical protein
MVSAVGWPIVRFASKRRSRRRPNAARRWNRAVSAFSTCAKKSRCAQACRRSLAVKNGVNAINDFWPPVFEITRRERIGEFLQPLGWLQVRDALVHCRNAMPSRRILCASQQC